MATVFKKCQHPNPARCRCNWTVRYRDAAGKQREKSSFLHDQKTLANDFRIKVEHDKRAGVYTPKTTVTFGEYAEQCISVLTGSDTTKSLYRRMLATHLGSIAGVKLSAVAQDRDGIKKLLLDVIPGNGAGRSQVELCQVVIVSTMNRAVEAGKIPGHNLGRIKLPAKTETVDDALIASATNARVEALAEGMPHQWALAVWLARGCGLRISEALGVKLSDFSEDMKVLTLARQVTSGTATAPLKARKPGETRSLPVPLYVSERVAKHVADHGTHNGYLFTGTRSPFTSESAFNLAFRTARDSAGLSRSFTFHCLRHTYASHLLASNEVDLASVSKWLGHKDVSITARIYAHSLPKTFEAARAFLDSEWK